MYKNPPSELELEGRRFYEYKKWNAEIEKEFKRRKEEEQAIHEPAANRSSDLGGESSKSNKKQKIKHSVIDCQAITSDPNR